jgi:hypothetical protein
MLARSRVKQPILLGGRVGGLKIPSSSLISQSVYKRACLLVRDALAAARPAPLRLYQQLLLRGCGQKQA